MAASQNGVANGKTTTIVEGNGSANGKVEVKGANGERLNNWQTPGPAAFDFRSDTSTTPTASMLASLATTTLLDDVSHADPTTNALERTCASLLGHSTGLLTLSGTMGNQLAARTHLAAPPHSILADHRAHIVTHEAGGVSAVSGAHAQMIVPSNGRYLTLEDVQEHTVLPSDDYHLSPTRLISLENTLGGAIMPLEEAKRITGWAREQGIPTHLDGARLWESVAAQVARGEYGGSLEAGMGAYGGLFDSVTVCFSKGLGAPVGSVLVGPEAWVKRARHLRKMMGGGMRMTGVIAAPAMTAIEDTFYEGRLVRSHEIARKLGKVWEGRGGKIVGEVETNMIWLDLAASGVPAGVFKEEAEREGLQVYGGGKVARVVCHYQICDEAMERLERVFGRMMERREEGVQADGNGMRFRYGGESKAEDKKAAEEELEKVDCA
ncbi:MAG: hypothetical protein MMC23_008884 [Stictis urceolatum]|nr:hypothetical protein [Stictis urceolata]